MIAKIAVSAAAFAFDRAYSYRVPEGMQVVPGQRVTVPFGRGNRRSEGMVIQVVSGDESGLKPIEQVVDQEPLLSETMLRLASFMEQRYFCTYYQAVRAMLPAVVYLHHKQHYTLKKDLPWREKTISCPGAVEVLTLLEQLGGSAVRDALKQAVPEEQALDNALQYLVNKKWVTGDLDISAQSADKTEQIAVLAVSPEEALAFAQRRPKSATMQKAVLELLCSVESASVKDLCYFTGASRDTVKRLEKLGYVNLESRPVLRCREIRPAELPQKPVLNSEQQTAYDGLCRQWAQEKPGSALLYGVTGSGKTAVYLHLIENVLKSGKSALFLVPEIALTPQLLGLLAAWFGEQVAVLHSSLPPGERYDQWKRVRSGQARVVAGTRSAVFAPCKQLGLIILDEEQEHSYKSENAPRYDAREIAIWRGDREGALVVLGSATPRVETMYRAKLGQHQLYTLTQRYNGQELPQVEVVDMRQEVRSGNDGVCSRSLREQILATHEAGHQSILLLNRRGNSRALVCVDCRQAPECPRCSARLTYHSANERLMCHYCGFSQSVPRRCPSCGGPFRQLGVGTQKAQQELEAILPGEEILRMDADTVSASNTHEKILEHFKKDNVPLLLGTQMVAKGLDMPNVTLVGVLDGDLGLYTDSFRGTETTFDMLTQVVGRAGRGQETGKALIQTLVPEHPVITLAAKQDYDGFYNLELPMRQMQKLPPFGDVLTITFTGEDENLVVQGAVKFRDHVGYWLSQPDYTGMEWLLLGPAPCPVPKINYHYRYRLTLRTRLTAQVGRLLAHTLRQFAADGAFRQVNVYADVNGLD